MASVASVGAELDFSRVRVLMAEPSGILRQGIRLALNNLGIRNITEAGSYVAAHHHCQQGGFDLVVMNAELDGSDTTFLLRSVRNGALGPDPFTVTVLLIAHATDSKVRAGIDAGPDDVLLIPFAADQLMSRLKLRGSKRKPFVVTHDYMGPDRRKEARAGVASAMQFQAPNPVFARSTGMPESRYSALGEQVFAAMRNERIKRLATHVEWECNSMMNRLREGVASVETNFASLFKLETVCEELIERVGGLRGHGTEQIEGLLNTSRSLKNSPSRLSLSDVETLLSPARRISATYAGR